MSKKSNIGKIALGTAVGVGIGVLLAPKKGSETREDLKNKLKELPEKVKNLKSKDLKNSFDKKIKSLEKEIEALDKEKVLKIAKTNADKIKRKADDLVALALESGNEALEKASQEIKEKAIIVTKNVLAKLENK